MSTYVTGFCGVGLHEGTKPRSASRKPMKVCVAWQQCACKCHADITDMFKIAERERIPIDNPDYSPHVFDHSYIQSSEVQELPSILSDDELLPGVMFSPSPGIIPGYTIRTFEQTKSGRAPRGQMEQWVKQACDAWVLDDVFALEGYPATVPYLARQITQVSGFDAQLGAIDGVLRRWERMGFAVIGQSPMRFESYTERGIELGLDVVKHRYKMGWS